MAALAEEPPRREAFFVPAKATQEIQPVQQHFKVSIQTLARAKPPGQWPLCHGLSGALLQPS